MKKIKLVPILWIFLGLQAQLLSKILDPNIIIKTTDNEQKINS
ncbi:MAG TPA: hypothetical protein VJ201_04280 [Candidatus Babeliales bacterium]|nr:hypothetical protein [Candidatus Babeliales bacterium]